MYNAFILDKIQEIDRSLEEVKKEIHFSESTNNDVLFSIGVLVDRTLELKDLIIKKQEE